MVKKIGGTKRVTILLVEDDPGDQELTRRALQEGVILTDLRIVTESGHFEGSR